MSDKPIIFSAPMVRALLVGRKTQTRRLVTSGLSFHQLADLGETPAKMLGALKIRLGTRLWVREAWGYDWFDDGQSRAWKNVVYRADPGATPMDNGDETPWRSPIHMPRKASRLTLTVTDVRVQRLHEISEEDARAEGCEQPVLPHWPSSPYRSAFRGLWNDIHSTGLWEENPYVAAYTFTVIKANIDTLPSPLSTQEDGRT